MNNRSWSDHVERVNTIIKNGLLGVYKKELVKAMSKDERLQDPDIKNNASEDIADEIRMETSEWFLGYSGWRIS